MNTLIANQYGRVQGEAGGCGLTLSVTAQTPRRESVEFQTRVDSVDRYPPTISTDETTTNIINLHLEVANVRKAESLPSGVGAALRPRDESYSICSHNLSAEDARRKLNELGEDSLFAFTVDQPAHHAVDTADECTACRDELARVLAENQ